MTMTTTTAVLVWRNSGDEKFSQDNVQRTLNVLKGKYYSLAGVYSLTRLDSSNKKQENVICDLLYNTTKLLNPNKSN